MIVSLQNFNLSQRFNSFNIYYNIFKVISLITTLIHHFLFYEFLLKQFIIYCILENIILNFIKSNYSYETYLITFNFFRYFYLFIFLLCMDA